jgi:hypothetical protein
MWSSRGFLDRFRASGTPGAAAGAGVPADRVAERNVELAALFEQLNDVEAEVRRIRSGARQHAHELRESAAVQARGLMATARREADSERRDAAARIAARSEQEAAQTLASAADEAAAIRKHAEAAVPAYADRVVAMVLDRLEVDVPAPVPQVATP